MTDIAIIPARGGSKRLPRKNLLPFNGAPLVAWTIWEAAVARLSPIVTTDDDEIAEVAEHCGARVIRRPAYLSDESTHSVFVVLHALEQLVVTDTDVVHMLLPTCPLRSAYDITTARSLLQPTVSIIGVTPTVPMHCLRNIRNNRLWPVDKAVMDAPNRQCSDAEEVYRVNGAIFTTHVYTLREYKTFHTGNCVPYNMPPDRSVDIDTKEDFDHAESLHKSTFRDQIK